ncbi:putative aldehyde dehydrogenase [Sphingomonas changbaiensis NBRC 104936]|uniref:Aldehyde dehydrogenase n=1 Tax=Sphingomonas changbaiensis NBRC 104936 TaxID=1219043 RepID=A0A0E9ML11_9SPHN|nr:coniferyl aldehyde dehydrogenase [Sphingomonas changbaiensis]GAO38198.1 putative aldehyde dehydrogenase [Sphingomonas changbaiensis NBRC 104936]
MDLTALLQAQRTALDAERPVPLAARRDRLDRAIRMMIDNAERFCSALSEDFGHRSRELSMLADIVASVRTLKHARKNVDRWARPEKRPLQFPLGLLGARAAVEYQPKGVVGVIAPWNFPVQLAMAPLAGVFAAGNRAMIKTSEFTPRTAALFEEIVGTYFDPAELVFVSGGAEVGRAFSALPFDHLIFTGATSIGRHILHAAADNLTPVTLELGGKSPTIIGRSADLKQATERVAIGKLMNAGQICLAPDYLLVPDDKEDAVIGGLRSAAAALYPRMLGNADYTAVVNERHHVRLQAYLDDARAKGGDVIEVNPGAEDFAGSNGTRMPLFIVRNPTDDMAVMQDEIFGPVLPVKRYGAIDEAIDFVNRRDRPLGLYYFGHDAAEERRVLDRTISGGVTVNDVIFHISAEELPFGGIGPSGMGAYHGFDGFKTFSHARAIYRQPKIDIAKLAGFKPPYGATTAKAIARELKA